MTLRRGRPVSTRARTAPPSTDSSGSTAVTSSAMSTRRSGTPSTTPTSTAESGPHTPSTCAALSRYDHREDRPERAIQGNEPGDIASGHPPGVDVLDLVAVRDVAGQVVAQEVLAADAGPWVQPPAEVRPHRTMDAGLRERLAHCHGAGRRARLHDAGRELPREAARVRLTATHHEHMSIGAHDGNRHVEREWLARRRRTRRERQE